MARDSLRVKAGLGGSELWQSPHLSIHCDHAQRLLVVTRTPLPFQKVEEIEAATKALARVLPLERRKAFCILSDFREGPIRVHPALEPAFARYREESERGFRRAAVIVSTPVGRVRGDRLRTSGGVPLAMVQTIEDALAFLRSDSKAP